MSDQTDSSSKSLFKTGGAFDALKEVSTSSDELLAREFGAYRTNRLIADGGMSRVYQAERIDGTFERQVAIKVSARGRWNREFRERFQQEQAVLATLDHPGICRLFDADVTEDGYPWFVMELIDGQPITDYCLGQSLNVDERVRLFVDVVDAIAYAHARLVVHRDIKPGNVMVDRSGAVKLLDFGIAKSLAEDKAGEMTRINPMTPEWASPEQLLGQPITIASDVYQLGRLLASMLVDDPFDSATSSERARLAAQDRDLVLSQQTTRKLPGDVVAIIERCVRARAGERYSDANALRSDLEACLAGFPVSAAEGRAAYRLSRFAKRNRAAVVTAAVALTAIAGGTIAYTVSLGQARDLAEQRADAAERVTRALATLTTEFMATLQDQSAERRAGSTDLTRTMLQEAMDLVSAELDAGDRSLATMHRIRGNIERQLGQYDAASASLARAKEILGPLDRSASALELRLDQVELLLDQRENERARQQIEEAKVSWNLDTLPQHLVARLHSLDGYLSTREADFAASVEAFQRAIETLDPIGDDEYRQAGDIYNGIATALIMWERFPDSLEAAREAVRLHEAGGSETSFRLIDSLRALGTSYSRLDDFDSANAPLQRAVDISLANFGRNHVKTSWSLFSLAQNEFRLGNLFRAIEIYEDALEIDRRLFGEDSWDVITTQVALATAYSSAGRVLEAIEIQRSMIDALLSRQTTDTDIWLETMYHNLARNLRVAGDPQGSLEAYRQGFYLRARLKGPETFAAYDSQRRYAYALLLAGNREDAEANYSESLAGLQELHGDSHPEHQVWVHMRYLFDREDGNLDAARRSLEIVISELSERYDIDSVHFLRYTAELADINQQLGDFDAVTEALQLGAKTFRDYPEHPESILAQVVLVERQTAIGGHESARESVDHARQLVERNIPGRQDLIQRLDAVDP